jgi:hypothetical protein
MARNGNAVSAQVQVQGSSDLPRGLAVAHLLGCRVSNSGGTTMSTLITSTLIQHCVGAGLNMPTAR